MLISPSLEQFQLSGLVVLVWLRLHHSKRFYNDITHKRYRNLEIEYPEGSTVNHLSV